MVMTTSEGTWSQNYRQPLLTILITEASDATWTEGVSNLGIQFLLGDIWTESE